MKFTKQDALESLRRELTNNGRKSLRMSEKSLDKLTDNLIGEFADDEIGLPDFCTKALNILSVFNDNVGKEKSDMEKEKSDFIKQWETEHPEKQASPKNDEPEPKVSPELTALMERIAALEKDKEETEKRASLAQKKNGLAAKLKEKGVTDSEWIDLQLSKVNFDREFDMEAEASDYVKLYNKSQSNGSGAPTPLNPSGEPANKGFLDSVKRAGVLAKSERATIETK